MRYVAVSLILQCCLTACQAEDQSHPKPEAPIVEGRKVSDWIDALDKGTFADQEHAVEVLGKAGASVGPYLAGLLKSEDTYLRFVGMKLAAKQETLGEDAITALEDIVAKKSFEEVRGFGGMYLGVSEVKCINAPRLEMSYYFPGLIDTSAPYFLKDALIKAGKQEEIKHEGIHIGVGHPITEENTPRYLDAVLIWLRMARRLKETPIDTSAMFRAKCALHAISSVKNPPEFVARFAKHTAERLAAGPVIEGKPLVEWTNDLASGEFEKGADGYGPFMLAGEDAPPFLLKYCDIAQKSTVLYWTLTHLSNVEFGTSYQSIRNLESHLLGLLEQSIGQKRIEGDHVIELYVVWRKVDGKWVTEFRPSGVKGEPLSAQSLEGWLTDVEGIKEKTLVIKTVRHDQFENDLSIFSGTFHGDQGWGALLKANFKEVRIDPTLLFYWVKSALFAGEVSPEGTAKLEAMSQKIFR